MNELPQKLQRGNNAKNDPGPIWSVEEKEIGLEMVRSQLEKAISEERMAKRSLEDVLEDNYRRQEEMLELIQLLKDKDDATSQEIQTLKDEHNCQLTELKRRIEKTEAQKFVELTEKLDLAEANFQRSRDASKKTNERFLCLISDFVKMSSVFETKVNAQLSISSLGSFQSSVTSPSPTQSLRWNATDQSVDERGASSTASTADEGLEELPRFFTDGFVSGSELDPDYEEALREVGVAVQRSFERLFDELRLREVKSNAAEKSLEIEMKKNEELEERLLRETSSLAEKHQFEAEDSLVKRQLEEEEAAYKLRTQLDEMGAQLGKKEARILQLTEELDSSEEDLARLRQAYNREKNQRQDLALKADGEILALNDRIGEEKRLNAEKSRQVEDLEKMSAALRRELDVMKRQKQFRRIDELEADVEKLRLRCADSEADAFTANQTLERVRNEADMQLRHLTQIIDEMKRHHKEELEDLLEVKEKDLKSLHARELDKLIQANEELKSLYKIQLETANNQNDMEEFRKELETFHQKKMSDLLKQKEEEFLAQHRKEMEGLERENQKELERLHSKHVEDIEDVERFVESEKQKQIKRLVEKHRSEIADFDEELNRKGDALETAEKKLLKLAEENETEMGRISEIHAKELNDMRIAFDLQNERNLKSAADRYAKEIQHLRNLLNAAETTIEELNIKANENKLRLESDGQKMEKKYEQVVRHLEDDLENHRRQIEVMEKRLLETQNQNDRVLEDIGLKHEEENNNLRLTLTKDCDGRIEETRRNHQQEIEAMQEDMAKYRNFTALMQQNYELELREKAEEIAKANSKLAQELSVLQSQLEVENDTQFRDLSGKYEEEFEALRAELEKKDGLLKDMETRHSYEIDEMKTFVDQIVQERDQILRDTRGDIKMNETETELLRGDLDTLQQMLKDQQQSFEAENLRARDEIKNLETKHFDEIEDLKRQHLDYLNDSAEEYRLEMSRLRAELCTGSEILRDLNAEHSREISQLRAELERSYHSGTGFPENPETFESGYEEKFYRDDEQYRYSNGILERQKLLEENEAFRRLIKDCVEDFEAKGSEDTDWRTKMLTSFYEVLTKQLKRVTASEIYRLSENPVGELKEVIEMKMIEQENWLAEGFDRIMSVDRKLMLSEIDSLRHEIVEIQQEILNDEKAKGTEAQLQRKLERLKNQLNSSNMQLNQEREFSSELQSTLAAEKILIEELKDQLSRERTDGERLKEKSSRLEAELAAVETELQIERNKLIAALIELDKRRSEGNEASPDIRSKTINVNGLSRNNFANRWTEAHELDSDDVEHENHFRTASAKTSRNSPTRSGRKPGPRTVQSSRRPSLPSTRSRSPDTASSTLRRSGFLSRSWEWDSHMAFVRTSPSPFDSRKSE